MTNKSLEVNDFFTERTLTLISGVQDSSDNKQAMEIESLIHEYITLSGADLPTAIVALTDLLSTYLMTADQRLIRKLNIPSSYTIH